MRRCVTPVLLVLLVSATPADGVTGRDEPDAEVESQAEAKSEGEPPAKPSESTQAEEPTETEVPPDPCKAEDGDPDDIWIDKMRRGVYRTVCATSRWFDGFYGDQPLIDEYRSTYGRLGVGIEVVEEEGVDFDDRFEARFPLPQFERRLEAFVGRYDEDDFVEGRERSFDSLPETFDDTDSEWLLGLGYNPARGERGDFELDLGVDVGFPMDPFVRALWTTEYPIGEVHLLRFRQVGFWRNSDGLGTTSQIAVERALRPRLLVRWFGIGTVAEKIRGIEWYSSLTLYQRFDLDRAISYQVDVHGESDAPVAVEEWALNARYRHRMWRDWFFLDLRAHLQWPKELPGQGRDVDPGFTVGFEILFGDHPSLVRYRAEKERRSAGGSAADDGGT